MKKTVIILLIIGICLILAGAAAFCLAMAKNSWDFRLLNNQKMETKTFEITEDFRDISILFRTEDVDIQPSENGICRVVCYEREKEEHTVTVADGKLMIRQTDTRNWTDHVSSFSMDSPTITVYLPGTAYGVLSMEGSTGDVSIPAGFIFSSIEVSLSTGHAVCDASASGVVRIKTDTGSIRATGLTAEALDLTVTTGQINLQSVACEGEVGIHVSTGKTELAEISCNSLISSGSTGDITLKDVIVSDTVSIQRSTGDVRFDRSDAGELQIETGTGDVTGTLLSEKVFVARSDTSRIEVPETMSGGKCKITTGTGHIRIEIIG